MATSARECSELKSDFGVNIWELREACLARKKGWIKEDGSIDEEIKTKYAVVGGDSIAGCFETKSKKVYFFY